MVSRPKTWKGTTVPCGRCLGCRLERSRQWAVRIMNEAQMYEFNHFITLTYRNEELKYGVSETTGNVRATLVPQHLRNFWKRLRKEYGAGIRYFGCGEYGDKFGRPHYHACIFNLNIKDQKYKTTKNGNHLYSSDMLDRIWGHGDVTFGALTYESAAYVARYVMKKQTGKNSEMYKDEGIEPEFARMSNKPGIGKPWLDKYFSDVYPRDTLITRKGIKVRPPRYYDKLAERKDSSSYATIKAKRKMELSKIPESEFTNKRLAVKERVKRAQYKLLPRTLE